MTGGDREREMEGEKKGVERKGFKGDRKWEAGKERGREGGKVGLERKREGRMEVEGMNCERKGGMDGQRKGRRERGKGGEWRKEMREGGMDKGDKEKEGGKERRRARKRRNM